MRLSPPTVSGRSCARASVTKWPPRFAGRTAWRGLIPAREVAPEFREPQIHLWLGRDAHLVHYPVKAGRIINVVVITGDSWNSTGWSEPASRAEIVPRLAAEAWAPAAARPRRPPGSVVEVGPL